MATAPPGGGASLLAHYAKHPRDLHFSRGDKNKPMYYFQWRIWCYNVHGGTIDCAQKHGEQHTPTGRRRPTHVTLRCHPSRISLRNFHRRLVT